LAQFPGESVARRDVADGLVLQVLLPIPTDGAFDVAGAVGSGIDVDLDKPEAWLAEVLGQPLSADQGVFGDRTDGFGHEGHTSSAVDGEWSTRHGIRRGLRQETARLATEAGWGVDQALRGERERGPHQVDCI